MSLSIKGAPTNSKKLSGTGKATALNPNAAEFIPSALRSSSGFYSPADVSTSVTSVDASGTGIGPLGKPVPDRSESSISNNFDEEAHLYWRHQLPDDITPDFKIMGEDESQAINSAPFSILSIHDTNEASRFSASAEKMRQNTSSYGEDASSANFPHSAAKAWGKPIGHNDQLLITVRDGEGPPYKRNSRQGLQYEHAIAEKTEMNPLEFLASQFPGFSTESLAEVCFATGGDLNLTIEMLTQLELQVDGGLNQNLYSKALSAPNVDSLDFPALSTPDGQNSLPKFAGDDNQLTVNGHRSSIKDTMLLFKSNSSIPTRGAIDFASAVRKMSSQDSGIWKYERNASADAIVGSSTSAHVLASSYNGGRGKGINSDRLQNRSSSQPAPVWLETGEAVANLYSEMRDEARDHARLRNAYFDQARQAYLIGNKALAKELCVKGQLHNLHMKAAHGKAQESIYRQRNPVNPEMPRSGRGLEKIIDLHGLHASEATHVLKRELALLRGTARSAEQQLQVYICVGTGHHTRGSRTPARLPIAVQRYLLEEEGLDYSEPQPGLLRVVIF